MLNLQRLQNAAEGQKSCTGAFDSLGAELSVFHISGKPRHDLLTEEDVEILSLCFVERQANGVGADVDDRLLHSASPTASTVSSNGAVSS